jgi:hypothetical protein
MPASNAEGTLDPAGVRELVIARWTGREDAAAVRRCRNDDAPALAAQLASFFLASGRTYAAGGLCAVARSYAFW